MPEQSEKTWELDGATWCQGADKHDFKLLGYRGLGRPHQALTGRDVAELVGAHWREEENRLYPGPFRHSPATGHSLAALPKEPAESWLPPYGNDPGQDCQGLRLSHRRLALRPELKPEDAPDVALPAPPEGEYQFLVDNFSTRVPLLLAVNPGKGQLYLYLRHAGRWQALSDGGTPLPSSRLLPGQWGVAWQGGGLFLPTEEGLVRVELNALALSYRLERVQAGRCLGAPALWRGSLFVPVLDKAARLGVSRLSADAGRAWMPCGGVAESLNLPIIEESQLLWLGASGQIVLRKPGIDGDYPPRFIPWPQGDSPQFEFGSPYLDGNSLWQLCFSEAEGRYVYVQLGEDLPERQAVSAPRFSSGNRVFYQGTPLKNIPPWQEPEQASQDQGQLILPMLEFAGQTVLCFKLDWTKGSKALFAEGEPTHTATFEINGPDGNVAFFRWKLPRPWLAQAFVYRDTLYLCHPDKDTMPGWRLA